MNQVVGISMVVSLVVLILGLTKWALADEKTEYESWSEENKLKDVRRMLVNRKGGDKR